MIQHRCKFCERTAQTVSDQTVFCVPCGNVPMIKIPPKIDPIFSKIDWALLRDQKEYLVRESHIVEGTHSAQLLEGVITLLDALQDRAIQLGMSGEDIYG